VPVLNAANTGNVYLYVQVVPTAPLLVVVEVHVLVELVGFSPGAL
jgi:hypothetical protein